MREIVTLGAGNTATLKYQLPEAVPDWKVIVGMSNVVLSGGANWDRLDKSVDGTTLTLAFKGLRKGDFNLGVMVQGHEPGFYQLTFV